ncbi:MAG TPA: hypothetical protein VGI92_06735, partial [Gemmatimonadales bacterium]
GSSINGDLMVTDVANSTWRLFGGGLAIQDLLVSADGKELYVADANRAVDIIDIKSEKVTASIPLNGGAFGMTLTSNGYLYVSIPDSGTVAVVDPVKARFYRYILLGGTPRRLATDALDRVIVTNEAGWVDILH